MNDFDALDDVLARARDGLSPSDAQVERMRAALPPVASGKVAAEAGALGGVRGPSRELPNRRWAALKATGGTGLAAGAWLVASGFVAGYFARSVVTDDAMSTPAPTELSR